MNRTATKIFFCLLLIMSLCAESRGEIRLGVLPFVSRSNEVSAKQASQVTEMVIRNLHSSPSMLITERERLRTVAAEQGFNFSSGVFDQDTAVKVGSIAGCQYILFGAVRQITERFLTESFLLSSKALKETSAVIEARVIDVATRRVVLSVSESGSFTEIQKESLYSSNNRRAALEIAASGVCDKILAVLAGEYPAVISVRKNKIRINRGRNSGINAGTLYRVYQEVGNSEGKKSISIAVIRVTDVQSGFCTAEIIKPDIAAGKDKKKTVKEKNNTLSELKLIKEGDKVEIISFSEAEKIKLSSQRI